ncbi:MAG: hypothetical protein U0T73_04885 [Chitinophagales bacterium]
MKKTTKILASVAVLCALILAGCSKENTTAYIDLGTWQLMDDGTVRDHYIESYSTIKGSDIKSIFSAAGISESDLDRLKEVKLDTLRIEAEGGHLLDAYDFGDVAFVRDADTVKVAYAGTIDKTAAEVKMESQFNDLAKFVNFTDFKIRTRVYRNVAAPTGARVLTGHLRLRVVVAPK